MIQVFIAALVAAFFVVGLTDVTKNLLPTITSTTKGKTIASLVIAVVCGVLCGLVADFSVTGFAKVVQVVMVVIATVVISQVFYNYLLKPWKAFVEWINTKVKSLKKD